MDHAAQRLAEVREAIASAARLARRTDNVQLIAVTKGRPAAAIEPLIAAGQRDFGESRVQEALDKWPALEECYPGIRLHCVGRLQTNKAREAARLFDVIHSLDRQALLDALIAAAARDGRAPLVYVQVNIGEEPQKGGCALPELGRLIEQVRSSPLPLAGLMAIPPAGLEPGPFFALLAKLGREHGVAGLSIGMSSDYRTAVMLGATAVRVGSALFEEPEG